MGKSVEPRTFLVGYTCIDYAGLTEYLLYTGNEEFLDSVHTAKEAGLSDGEILCSFYAKICYKSLTLGQNANVTRIRDIPDNLKATIAAGHGSVFEHATVNFVTTDCSRVFTHELVRHRVGLAFSQTSGRYVALDDMDMVDPPELMNDTGDALVPCPKCYELWPTIRDDCNVCANHRQVTPKLACAVIDAALGRGLRALRAGMVKDGMSFAEKKKLTSAIRRRAPNGQSNEIGWSINLRALRHVLQLRTAAGAEWEIRRVFNQVYDLVKARFPLLFHDAQEKVEDGQRVVYGMRTQPYDEKPG